MDLNTIKEVRRPAMAGDVSEWGDGFAWLAGGTWLFSEPQPKLHTLVDTESLRWPALVGSETGLEIAATCTIAELDRFVAPSDWVAAPLFGECCRSFLASFKIWNEATVGGNICMALPAGPMISLTTALEGIFTLWPIGGGTRQVAAIDFVTGNNANVLAPGELLRSIYLPASALVKKYAFRRASLTQLGRSAILLIGTRCRSTGKFLLTVTAATDRPVQLAFANFPSEEILRMAIDEGIPDHLYFDDVHGSPSYRRHMTYYYAAQICEELAS
jgi:CO/xanthine dehydrogenase FAD-binding subunit